MAAQSYYTCGDQDQEREFFKIIHFLRISHLSYAMHALVAPAPIPDSDPIKAKIWQPRYPVVNPLVNEL